MRIRFRHLVALGSIGLAGAIAACSSDDSTPGAAAGISAGEYKGELSGKNETGVLDITLKGGSLATSSVGVRDTQDQANAAGTVTVNGRGTLSLSGTFDPDTGVLTLSGGGYTFSGTASGSTISGSYSGPGGAGSFTLIKGSGAQVFCGTYAGADRGTWNLVVGPTSAAGSVSNGQGSSTKPIACNVSGANLSCTGSGGLTASGTVNGTNASGTWDAGSGQTGTWTGSTGACPVPVTITPEAGVPDATPPPPFDASVPDAGGADTSTPDTGAADAGHDAVTPDAATPDAAAADSGTPDASPVQDSSPVDATPPVDSSVADSATPDAAIPDSAVADAGITDSAVVDSGPTDAGQCPHIADITGVNHVVLGGSITQIGVATANYPVNPVINASVCPGVTHIQVALGSNPNAWTDIGACTGKGAGPNNYCYGIVIPSTFFAVADSIALRAVNPGVNQGASSPGIEIVPGNPSPTITSGTPTTNLKVGQGAQQITFTGTGFTGHSTAEADFSAVDAGVATIPVVKSFTSTSMTIEFSAQFTATAQPYFLVKVINPGNPTPLYDYWGYSIDVQ